MPITIRQLALTSVSFLTSQLILIIVLQFSGFNYLDSNTWSRWDSGHYVAIAQNGYNYFPCAGKFGYPLDASEMCGNTGWFPGYPLLLKLFSFINTDLVLVGRIISKIGYFISILMVVILHRIERFTFKNIVYLLIPTFCFGFIYYNAVFPISTTLAFSLVGLFLFLQGKHLLSGLFALVVSILYPTGFLLSVALAFTLFIRELRNGMLKNLTRGIPILFGGGLGVVLTFLFFQLQVDDWTAFMQVQSKYKHGIHNPIESIINMINSISFDQFSLNDAILWQSVFVLLGYFMLSFFFFRKRLYREDLYMFSYLFTTIFLVFPWIVGGNLSMYRAESLLFPFALMLKDIKCLWMIILLIIELSIGVIMSHLFFTSVLI